MTSGHRRGRMVQSFFLAGDPDRRTTQRAGHLPREADRLRVSVNSKNPAFQGWHGDAAKRLQRMHRTDGCAMRLQNAQRIGAPRTAGVQDHFAGQFVASNARQLPGNGGNLVIGGSNEDHARRKNGTRYAWIRVPRADKAYGLAGAHFATRHDRTDFPSQLAEAPTERASHASRTDD